MHGGWSSRRGAVVAQAAICMGVMTGFAALAVDVGHVYNVRTELQRSADAAALAAAATLSDWSMGDPRPVAVGVAQQYANLNEVLGAGVTLDQESDVQFGAAHMLDSGKYEVDWAETDPIKLNAVRVRLRRTSGSPSGPVPLFFANVLGVSNSDVAAQATAVMTPRDISFVLDLSASHNDDSSLRSYRNPALDVKLKKFSSKKVS